MSISVKQLEKTYGDVQVLKDVSIEIADGEIYGIIGHSGAGKSTLLRCLNGLENYQAGEVLVDGQEVSALKGKELRDFQKGIGMIFQNFNLLSRLNVYDNVALPLVCHGQKKRDPKVRDKVNHLLEVVGLSDKAHERPRNLSGGQKQRVAIARALALDPKILLCDEATSALDPQTTKEILSLLLKINQELQITIVVVTHQMEVVKQVCQRVAFLKDGLVVASGDTEDVLISTDAAVREFLGNSWSTLPEDGANIHIMYDRGNANDPVLAAIARDLKVEYSLVWGTIENFRSGPIGSLIINVKEDQTGTITEYLNAHQIRWEIIPAEKREAGTDSSADGQPSDTQKEAEV